MKPPSGVSPSALFLKLCEVPSPSEVVDFPRVMPDGTREQIRIRVLPMSDHNRARLAAQQWLASQKMSVDDMRGPAAQEVLGDRIAQELLATACVSVEPIDGSEQTGKPCYVRLFRSADDLAQFSADELAALFWSYSLIQEKYGPSPSTMTDDDVTEWIKVLVEGASELPLSSFTWRRLVELSMSLARRAYTLSAILEPLCSTLPDSLASNLTTWGIGTTSFTLPHADASIVTTSDPSSDGPAVVVVEGGTPVVDASGEPVPALDIAASEVTPARALELSRMLTGRGNAKPI